MAIFEGFSLEDVRLADDVVPIVEALERADAQFAEEWWHWFFFASDQAERVITADPMAWYRLDPAEMARRATTTRSRPSTTPASSAPCSVASSPARQRPVTPGSDAQDPDDPPRNIPQRITEASRTSGLRWGRSLAR